jgi:hypothetical protein
MARQRAVERFSLAHNLDTLMALYAGLAAPTPALT